MAKRDVWVRLWPRLVRADQIQGVEFYRGDLLVKVTGEKDPIEVAVCRYPRENDFLGLGGREKYAAAVQESNTALQQSAFGLLAGISTAARLPDGGVLVMADDEDEDTPRWQVLTLPEFEPEDET
ncbi:hypothetical protein [Streptomyces noursei]|uniref:hypothetical protein n=1 Tax=Streptomyces noursei TaxID=1971 RepID=UPI00167601BE|nr:hypothetical protein [Streptomyces noursei]MCZ1021370.1 hypothetical protein [Streptomyces noursei]GGX54443.1 hypothetical protein GCM10010341_89450 [Streptomyces noursei]